MRIINRPKKGTYKAGYHSDLGGYATRVSDIPKLGEMEVLRDGRKFISR